MVADLKGKCVFNFTENLVVYSLSVSKQCQQLHVLGRLQSTGFTLNRDKVVLGASEIILGTTCCLEGFPRRWN